MIPSRLLVSLALVLGGCARSTPEATRPPEATAPPETPPLELRPRYASTFESHTEGCRNPLDDHHGEVVLTIGDRLETTLELTWRSPDVQWPADLTAIGPDGEPIPIEPSGPTVCRFDGTGTRSPEGIVVTLTLPEDSADGRCGEAVPFELSCRPESLELPDPAGQRATIEVLRCTLGEPHPAVLSLAGPSEALVLAEGPLHSRVERVNWGLEHRELVRGQPQPAETEP